MVRWIKIAGVVASAALAAFLVAAPNLLTSFYLKVLTEMLIYGLLALSLNLLVGYTGLAPLGQAGIFGVSAYVAGYLTVKLGQPMYIAVAAGILGAVVISAVFGAMAIRTSGIYFLMITLAQGMIVWGLAYRWDKVTGAENGIRGIQRPEVLGEFSTYYYVVLAVVVLLVALMYRIVNSPFGLTLQGIREGEKRMHTLGYNVALHKFLGFVLAGTFSGIAGAMYVYFRNFVSPATVEFGRSAEALLMVILGGAGTFFGPMIGSVIITLSRHQISLYTERWPMIMGAIFVATILVAPDGIVGGSQRLWTWASQAWRSAHSGQRAREAARATRKEVSGQIEALEKVAGDTASPTD